MTDIPDDSAFRRILVAAKRAEQLINGARPRLDSVHVKPTTIALAELAAGKVPWRPVTSEEYDLLQQQEMAARSAEEPGTVFVRPTPAIVAPVEEVLEADEELDEEEFEDEFEEAGFDDDLEVDENLLVDDEVSPEGEAAPE